MADSILYQIRDQAAWITLNRPEVHNALDTGLTRALDEALERALSDPSARMIVLAGAGRTFSAGLDLSGDSGGFVGEAGRLSPFQSAVQRMVESPKPVVGRIQGGAFGAGLGLVLACDLAVAADSARFGVTELRFGIPPTVIPVLLNHKLLLGPAREILLTGERFGADKALRLSLVHRLAPEAALDTGVEALLHELLHCAPRAFATGKTIQRTVRESGFAEGLAYAGDQLRLALQAGEAREGLAAYREKRKPRWAP